MIGGLISNLLCFGGRKSESEITELISQCGISKFITLGAFNKTQLSIQ